MVAQLRHCIRLSLDARMCAPQPLTWSSAAASAPAWGNAPVNREQKVPARPPRFLRQRCPQSLRLQPFKCRREALRRNAHRLVEITRFQRVITYDNTTATT